FNFILYCIISLILFFFLFSRLLPISTLFPYTTLFRSLPYMEHWHEYTDCFQRWIIDGSISIKVDSIYSLKDAVDAHIAVENRNTDRKSTRLNSSHVSISYAVFCLKKYNTKDILLQLIQ